MSSENDFDTYKEGEEARGKLKSKALKLAYEIASQTENINKIKLTFEQFDFIFKKTHEAAIEGFVSGMFLSYQVISAVYHKRQ